MVNTVWQAEGRRGLAQNSVQAALQARDGYVWLGTQEGLVRFDGVTFTGFDRRSVPELPSDDVRALLEQPTARSGWPP